MKTKEIKLSRKELDELSDLIMLDKNYDALVFIERLLK